MVVSPENQICSSPQLYQDCLYSASLHHSSFSISNKPKPLRGVVFWFFIIPAFQWATNLNCFVGLCFDLGAFFMIFGFGFLRNCLVVEVFLLWSDPPSPKSNSSSSSSSWIWVSAGLVDLGLCGVGWKFFFFFVDLLLLLHGFGSPWLVVDFSSSSWRDLGLRGV